MSLLFNKVLCDFDIKWDYEQPRAVDDFIYVTCSANQE